VAASDPEREVNFLSGSSSAATVPSEYRATRPQRNLQAKDALICPASGQTRPPRSRPPAPSDGSVAGRNAERLELQDRS
jgi:hypothetical protein